MALFAPSKGPNHVGEIALQRIKELIEIPRALVSAGNFRTTDKILELTGLEDRASRVRFVSGQEFGMGWKVPNSWDLKYFSLTHIDSGDVIVQGTKGLAVPIGSIAVDTEIDRTDLEAHLFTSKLENATPYVTMYYSPNWGFCLTPSQKRELKEGRYRAIIEVESRPSEMELLEVVVPGATTKEIVVATYSCHPYMANNELSGPVVWMALLEGMLASKVQPQHTFRFYMGPETIGAIAYMHYLRSMASAENHEPIAVVTITCVGMNTNPMRLMPSKDPTTAGTQIWEEILRTEDVQFVRESFLSRGSDERQWSLGWPGTMTSSLMSERYHAYPEYHTSADDLSLISADALTRSVELHQRYFEVLDNAVMPTYSGLGEPKLDAIKLYPTTNSGGTNTPDAVRPVLNFLMLSNGTRRIRDISNILGVPEKDLNQIYEALARNGVVR